VGLALIWWWFAPISLGGPTRFVVINGNSMAPLYLRGDLVITRAATDYAVGDIVTYRHPEIGLVIHRIIGQNGERWLLKGDHNDFIDPYQPLPEEIEGRAWLHIPRLGSVFVLARQYWFLILAVLVGGTLMTRQYQHAGRQRRQRWPDAQPVEFKLALVTLSAMGALIVAALTGYAFLQPTSRVITESVGYRQQGTFTYVADAPDGIYDTTQAQTGDPVYFQLSSTLIVDFRYELRDVTAADGTIGMDAEVSAANGWRRRLTLMPAMTFNGPVAMARGVINLAELRALIVQLEQQTGLSHQYYLLAIIPTVMMNGEIEGLALNDTFAPQLLFRFDKAQLTLVNPNDSQQGLAPWTDGNLTRMRVEPAQITLFFYSLGVQELRLWGSIIAGGLTIITLAVGWPLWRRWQHDEAFRIQVWYGNLIISGAAPTVDLPRVEVATIADLARLTQRSGGLMMRDLSRTPVEYLLIDHDTVYVYRSPASATDHANTQTLPAPVPRVTLSEDWRDRFLAALRQRGLIGEACQAAGIDPFTAYRERSVNPAFARAWQEARQLRWDRERGEA